MSESAFEHVAAIATVVKYAAIILLVAHLGLSWWLVALFVAVVEVEVWVQQERD